VSKNRFARRSVSAGIALLMLSLLLSRPAKGAEVVITVTGTLAGGNDYLGVFGIGRVMPAGTPYTLVFTVDDTKGQAFPSPQCSNSGSGFGGVRGASPVTAVLIVGKKSFEFGRRPDAHSKTWRTIASRCSASEIGMEIMEAQYPLQMGVSIRVAPWPGAPSLTQDGNWRSALTVSNVYARNTFNHFVITQPGNNTGGTESYLLVSTVTIGGAKPASSTPGSTAAR